jgi:hypothetical protein
VFIGTGGLRRYYEPLQDAHRLKNLDDNPRGSSQQGEIDDGDNPIAEQLSKGIHLFPPVGEIIISPLWIEVKDFLPDKEIKHHIREGEASTYDMRVEFFVDGFASNSLADASYQIDSEIEPEIYKSKACNYE